MRFQAVPLTDRIEAEVRGDIEALLTTDRRAPCPLESGRMMHRTTLVGEEAFA